MTLVDNHVGEVAQEPCPFRIVVLQDAQMEHLRIGQNDPGPVFDVISARMVGGAIKSTELCDNAHRAH